MTNNVHYCKHCLSEFKPANASEYFCSEACSKAYEANNKMESVCDRCGAEQDGLSEYEFGESVLKLCSKCSSKFETQIEEANNQFTGLKSFELAAKHILIGLQELGFEPDWDNFHDTPKRFARAYCEMFSGCSNTQDQVKEILATSFPSEGSENMVVAKDIVCFSACPHHLLPVEYHVCVGYIPDKDGSVLGISKLARLVNVLAKRPALQETFTQEICDCLDSVGSKGSIALVEGQHMCMRMRGAKATSTTITTTSVSGYFKESSTTKQEFFNNVSDRLKFRG